VLSDTAIGRLIRAERRRHPRRWSERAISLDSARRVGVHPPDYRWCSAIIDAILQDDTVMNVGDSAHSDDHCPFLITAHRCIADWNRNQSAIAAPNRPGSIHPSALTREGLLAIRPIARSADCSCQTLYSEILARNLGDDPTSAECQHSVANSYKFIEVG
jgi:hypothetical protein